MDHDNASTWLSWVNHSSANDSSDWNNHTDTIDPIYVFTPASDTAKRVIAVILSTVGGIGFFGNCFIFYYLSQKPSRNPIQLSNFVRNLNLYLKSLSLSDLLSCMVSLPLMCVQMFFDVFHTGWPCKIARYLHYIFPVITMNNLVVISIEKYLSTRSVQRTFNYWKIRKIIVCAWVLGLVVPLFIAASHDGTRIYLSDTHYTVGCMTQRGFYPFEISLIIVPLQYIIPSVLITYLNICLMKTVWSRGRRQIANGKINNAFKVHLKAKKIRGTTLLIALTFAFIISYFLHVANSVYTKIAKPQRDFSTDYIIRASAAAVIYLNSAINFVIYFAQMNEFRQFLKKLLYRTYNITQTYQNETGGRIANCRAYAIQHDLGIENNAVELKQFKTFNPL